MKAWDDNSGDWQGLKADDQRPRYAAIAAQIERLSPKTVLDIGCGEAVLSDFMPSKVTNYLGIEPSALALKAAESRNANVINTTAEEFIPDSRWDCIVFNEVLYYSADPIGLLRKYAKALTAEGSIIISIHQRPGRPSLKMRVRHWMDRRRPMSNVHCTRMVLTFLEANRWKIHHSEDISTIKKDSFWRLLACTPVVHASSSHRP